MDVITIIWYFSTFLLLILFFVVMVCSDNVCNRQEVKPEEPPVESPPTPAPSYREFAPPGYDTVMKKYKNRLTIGQGTFTSQMEPPPPASPISILSTDFPVTFRASVHEVPEVTGDAGLLELRVINTVSVGDQNLTRIVEEEQFEIQVIREEVVDEVETDPVPQSPSSVVFVNDKEQVEPEPDKKSRRLSA